MFALPEIYISDLFVKPEVSQNRLSAEIIIYNETNHASVYGWSIENEVLPALNVKCDDLEYKKMVYDGMGELVGICRSLDPTRNCISGDGSRDMDGRLPVYNIHYGSVNSYLEESAATDKPFVGAAIMMLQEEGKLQLDDPLDKYLHCIGNIWRIRDPRRGPYS